jgi:adenylate cyclase class 2
MYEVESKVRAGHEPVEAALEAAGATQSGAVEQVDVYFDAPHRDFAARDEALRLRTESAPDGTIDVLTYKGPRLEGPSKARSEHETPVGDPEALRATLSALGFKAAATVEKSRRIFDLDGFTVTLDSVADLGEFVEVETTVEDEQGVSEARAAVRATVERLGLDPEDEIEASYLAMLLDGND